jgi:hypothetical protein
MAHREPVARGPLTTQPLQHLHAARDDTAGLLADLIREVRERHVILFVGAGVSAGLGLPTWEDFIGRLGAELGFEPTEFLELSNDFRSLAEFYRLEKGSLEALCRKMAREWQVSDDKLAASQAHRQIVELDFPVVYTTNYDHLLERAYQLHGRRFNKIVTAADFAASDPALSTIVKFHGDLDDPSSIVLAETDYLERLSFEQPLDIKLSAGAFGKALAFIGYSVSDVNLRLLIYPQHGNLQSSGCERDRPRSYELMSKPNRVQERILDSWGVAPMIAPDSDEKNAVAKFLERLVAQRQRRL